MPQGAWIHSHNLKTNLHDDLEYTYAPKVYDIDCPKSDAKVMGYLRRNGTMGIRNELWIVPSVGCVNGQAQAIADRVRRECDCSHLDDVRVYTHNYGWATTTSTRGGPLRRWSSIPMPVPCWCWVWAARITRSRPSRRRSAHGTTNA